MQQFQVPQFIDIEDRIFGPLTLKQFLYLLGAAAIALICWSIFNFFVFIVIAVPIAAFFLAMAFLKINERPFPTIAISAINYYIRPRLYLWKRIDRAAPSVASLTPRESAPPGKIGKTSGSKLSDLAWNLDVNERTTNRNNIAR